MMDYSLWRIFRQIAVQCPDECADVMRPSDNSSAEG